MELPSIRRHDLYGGHYQGRDWYLNDYKDQFVPGWLDIDRRQITNVPLRINSSSTIHVRGHNYIFPGLVWNGYPIRIDLDKPKLEFQFQILIGLRINMHCEFYKKSAPEDTKEAMEQWVKELMNEFITKVEMEGIHLME